MAENKFLDLIGLTRFKNKITSLFISHTSDNNIHTSSEEKNKLSEAYIHSTSTHAPTDAEKNIIVGVQKNGSDVSVNSSTRKVNITVPTKVSELTNDAGYLTGETANTTYELSKDGNTITLTGSDGSTTSVTDSDTTYKVASSSTLGLVKSGTDITVDTSGNVSVNDNSHKHMVSNISDLTATASELNVLDGITATTTELNYTDGVTSNIQTQLNSKASSSHTHDDRYYTEPEIDSKILDLNNSITSHTENKSNPHGVTKSQVGLGNVNNTSDISKPVSTAQQTAIDTAYENSNAYTDQKIADLINGAPTTLDTLGEIATAMQEHEEVVSALNDAIGSKASQSELDTHTGNSTIHITASERTNWNTAKTHADSAHAPSNAQANVIETVKVNGTALTSSNKSVDIPVPSVGNGTITIKQAGTTKGTFTTNQSGNTTIELTDNNTTYSVATTSANGLMSKDDKSKLDGIAECAEVNQNAFNQIRVSSGGALGVVVADSKESILSLVSGENVNLGINSNGTGIVIASTDTVYTHPTTSGNKHIPSGGSSGQILRWSADGTAVWGADNNTTYSAGTGLSLSGTTLNHSNSITAGTAQGDASKTLSFGGTFTVPTVTYDAQGHITGKGTTTMTMPATPTSVSGNAGTSTKWSTARNINGMSVQGDANRFNYGTCSTAASTAAKVVSCSGYTLATGSEITVKFTVTNTASSPTLNVNNTGAKAIYYRGSAIGAGNLAANRTYIFRYNGTQYDLVGDINVDNDTKNTAGSTNISSKIFLVGAVAQGATMTTYSHKAVYVGTDNCLYSNDTRVVSEVVSSSEPSGQIAGDYWLEDYE